MNKNLAVADKTSDEQLLDQLVQDLFLENLRRELGIQQKSIEHGNDTLFNLDRKFIAEFKRLTVQLESICESIGEQTCELNDAKENARTHYRGLLDSLTQYKTDTAAVHDALHTNYQRQSEQLLHIQDALLRQSSELQAQSEALASLTAQHVLLSQQQKALQEQQFSATFDEIRAQNVAQTSFMEQSMLRHQQLLASEDRHRVEHSINRRWSKLVGGFTLANTLILVGMATVFMIKWGF